MNEWLWINENPPTEIGWYATTHCWDPWEGIIPAADYWNGEEERWPEYIRERSPQIFETEELAINWAYEHDMD